MIHPNTEVRFVSKDIGYGVFAKEFIPQGTVTFVQDPLDIEISQKKYDRLDDYSKQLVETYCFMDELGNRIVSWDNGKYVNHSCDCNTMSTGYGFEIALRDIQEGEQLTDEYGLFNIAEEFPISCGCNNCRKYLKPTDITTYAHAWDKQVKNALSKFNAVEQPLSKVIEPPVLREVLQYLAGKKPYKSVLSLKFTPKVSLIPES